MRAFVNRGFIYRQVGRLDDAISDYDAVLKLQGKDAVALFGRSIAKRKKGDAQGADADAAAARLLQADIEDLYKRYVP